jgi:tetratricopeptide (TPR) repeat protein
MRRTLWWKGLLVGWLVSLPLDAAAADGVTREARARFEEGLAYLKANNFEGARVSFAQSYAVLHRPSILWNLALAEEKSGHALEAIGHFKEYLRQFSREDESAAAKKHLDDLMAQTGHVEVAASAETQATVDGPPTGTAPPDVAPGRRPVEALPSERTDVRAPPATGFWTPRVIAVTAVGGAAIVSLGLGIGLALQARSDEDRAGRLQRQLNAQSCSPPAQCAAWNDAVDAQNRDTALSSGFYVAAGALAAGAVATWLLWPKQPPVAAWVMPTVGDRNVALSAAGRF